MTSIVTTEEQAEDQGNQEMTTELAESTSAQAGTVATQKERSWLRSTRSEAKRLKRRSFAGVGLALMVFFSLLASVITFLAGEGDGPGSRFGEQIDLASSEGLVAGLSTSGDLLGIVALSLWAAAAASDYSTGWVRVLVQAEPRRWRLFGGKLLALTGYTVIGTVVAAGISVAIAPVLAGATDVSTAAWSSGAVATIVGAWGNLTLAVLIWGVIGLAVATATRSVVVAIAGGIGYMMVVEGLLGMVLEDATTYLPGSVLSAVTSGGTESLAYVTAVALALAYAAASLALAGGIFMHRVITS